MACVDRRDGVMGDFAKEVTEGTEGERDRRDLRDLRERRASARQESAGEHR
jgi:hypothetical protein